MLYDYLKHIHFAYPLAFGLAALLPLFTWHYARNRNRQQAEIKVSTTRPLKVSTWKNRFVHLPFVCRMLALLSLIAVLARPQKINNEQHTEGEGIDIMLCMDVSGSMGSVDIPPSRMEVAKEVAEEFVQGRPADRIGLVIFSGEAFTQCPVTGDRNAVIEQIQKLESRALLKDGTVIGEGLATAVDRLTNSTAKSKVIILITDGKEDAPDTRLIDPLTALDIARARGVKVYTIGMGAAPVIKAIPKGNKPQQDARYDFIDEALLQKIASETGGQYFRAMDKQGLKDTYSQIDKLEKSKVEIINKHLTEEKYLPFMLAALVFIFLEGVFKYTWWRRFP